jgi:glycolate oxidase iron-sulfur subunit
MHTALAPFIKGSPEGDEAQSILSKCVHCGFCTATCPTYQLLGDELDGPRGRIYLIKQVLEGSEPTSRTQQHLDRCLTCRSCETTCPAGVAYGRLLDIGRKVMKDKVRRPLTARLFRWLLIGVCSGPLFGPLLTMARWLRAALPNSLQHRIPPRQRSGAWPSRRHQRKMILLAGCVQRALAPNINAASARVLDALEIEVVVPRNAGCCGALHHHLDDERGALARARANIDAWWPELEAGAEAIVLNASGCGAMVLEYAHLLRHDAAYAEKAARISAMTQDIAQVVAPQIERLGPRLRSCSRQRIAFHSPCTLQHAQGIRGVVESLVAGCGAQLLKVKDSHLCCGSAGTYSILQPELSSKLRDQKLEALMAEEPSVVVSANVGCITHLGSKASVPVQHWVEWLDARLNAKD